MAAPDIMSALPNIDLRHVMEVAMRTHAARSFWVGGAILTAGLLWRLLAELKRELVDEDKGRYGQVLLEAAALAAVMAAYAPFVTLAIRLVSGLGDMGDGAGFDAAFAHRAAAYHAWDVLHDRTGAAGLFSADGLMTTLLGSLTSLLHLAVQVFAFILRCVQMFALGVIVIYGPILLGLAFCARFFLPLGVSWFWALVEVSAWSATMDILLSTFGGFAADIPKDFSTVSEVAICATMLALLLAVPLITSVLVRGQAAGQLGYTVAAATYAVGKASRATASRAGKAGYAGARAAIREAPSLAQRAAGAWLSSRSRELSAQRGAASAGGRSEGLAQAAVAHYMASQASGASSAGGAPPAPAPSAGSGNQRANSSSARAAAPAVGSERPPSEARPPQTKRAPSSAKNGRQENP